VATQSLKKPLVVVLFGIDEIKPFLQNERQNLSKNVQVNQK